MQSVPTSRRVLAHSSTQASWWFRLLLPVAILFWAPAAAQTLDLLNSFPVTRAPVFSPGNNKAAPLKPNLWANVKKPYPTNSWWSNMALDDGKLPALAAPYMVRAFPDEGLSIGYPWPLEVQSAYVISWTAYHWTLGAVEGLAKRALTPKGPLMLNVQWNGLAAGAAGGTLQVPLAQGSPYITALFSSLTPRLTTPAAILSPPAGEQTGSSFTLSLNNGASWRLYFPSNVTITVAMNIVTLSAPFTGAMRLAMVPEAAAQSALDASSDLYPISSIVGATASDTTPLANTARYTFTWATGSLRGATGGSGKLLMLAMPHHVDVLSGATTEVVPALIGVYKFMLGRYTGILGSSWVLEEPLPAASWTAPRGIAEDKKAAIRQALTSEQDIQVTSVDPYFGSSQAAALGQAALIADELGEAAIAKKLRANLKASLDQWLNAPSAKRLSYDRTLGGVVSTAGLANSGADFGSGIYNDHHFHYGYLMYAAATLANSDPAWRKSRTRALVDLLRDYANPNTGDKFLPFARHMDFYSGHSWASGLWGVWDVKNQESTSEAVHAYYAVALLGRSLNHTRITQWGRLLMAMEIRAAQKYYQLKAASSPLPSPFQENKVVGILWATKVDYSTFFGAQTEFMHCIQHIPFRAQSEDLLPASWIAESFPVLKTSLTRPEPPINNGFKAFVFMAQAIIDPQGAWQNLTSHNWTWNGPHAAMTKTSALWWVATRPT